MKSLELENTNFTRFVSFPFVEKLPNSNLFWQNFEVFINSKVYKDKLCSFCKLKKRFPNPAFRGGVWMCSWIKSDFCVTWLYNCYLCKNPNVGAPFRYLVCYVSTHGKCFRSSWSQKVHQNLIFTHVFIAKLYYETCINMRFDALFDFMSF